ncbi:HxlR family transcriptional regulator [Saccharothrix sp. ALI-22-I]|uniref:winged helix-turn-helix transcriptional regulator n=1 Tax=Saccharothrix sp. ALI-22-I TaxID=1933778 RepID=UPI00097C3E7E|nr:helix-turn-helix domain-containing protein [Saccharothrix sp. ALI-22-I]ONI84666.1 HxlR family transcriptional regulator [Saccharothrix sp. ALI-22-I]
MLRRTYDDQVCSIARTLEVVGERWTLLIVRDALAGVTRFDGFLTCLPIARNVLSDRLTGLVEHGVLERVQYQDRPPRHEYRLTARGRELTPVILALAAWGNRHGSTPTGPTDVAEHVGCGGTVHTQMVCECCEEQLPASKVVRRPAGAATPPRPAER